MQPPSRLQTLPYSSQGLGSLGDDAQDLRNGVHCFLSALNSLHSWLLPSFLQGSLQVVATFLLLPDAPEEPWSRGIPSGPGSRNATFIDWPCATVSGSAKPPSDITAEP